MPALETDGRWIRTQLAGQSVWMDPQPGQAYRWAPNPCSDINIRPAPDALSVRVVLNGNQPAQLVTGMGGAYTLLPGPNDPISIGISALCNAPVTLSVGGRCQVRLLPLGGTTAELRCKVDGQMLVQ